MKLSGLLAALVAYICVCQAAIAQVSGAAADAIILVQPMGSGASLSVTFPKAVSHEGVKQRIARLGNMAGWRIGSVEVKDEEISTKSGDSRTSSLGKQTGATILVNNALLVREGGFVLQPFVQAFSDLRRIELLYFVQKQPEFAGLRQFDSRSVAINLVNDGGPYRYAIDIKEQGVPLPNLPLRQPAVASGPQPAAPNVEAAEGHRTSEIAFVLAVAATCSLVVLVAFLIIARFRAGQAAAHNSRRAHRS